MKRKMKCDEKIRGKEKRGEEEVGGCERKKAAFRGWVSVARARRRGNLLCPVTVNDVQLYYLLRRQRLCAFVCFVARKRSWIYE